MSVDPTRAGHVPSPVDQRDPADTPQPCPKWVATQGGSTVSENPSEHVQIPFKNEIQFHLCESQVNHKVITDDGSKISVIEACTSNSSNLQESDNNFCFIGSDTAQNYTIVCSEDVLSTRSLVNLLDQLPELVNDQRESEWTMSSNFSSKYYESSTSEAPFQSLITTEISSLSPFIEVATTSQSTERFPNLKPCNVPIYNCPSEQKICIVSEEYSDEDILFDECLSKDCVWELNEGKNLLITNSFSSHMSSTILLEHEARTKQEDFPATQAFTIAYKCQDNLLKNLQVVETANVEDLLLLPTLEYPTVLMETESGDHFLMYKALPEIEIYEICSLGSEQTVPFCGQAHEEELRLHEGSSIQNDDIYTAKPCMVVEEQPAVGQHPSLNVNWLLQIVPDDRPWESMKASQMVYLAENAPEGTRKASTAYQRFRITSKFVVEGMDRHVYKLGERGSGIRARGDVQDFYKIRDECLAEGRLFVDPNFLATDSSVWYSKKPSQPFQWKRPMELCKNPKLFVEGYSRFDVLQGELGDCWLLAAIANLTMHRGHFEQVVPLDQGFELKYAGIFHFRFWRFGRWVDVVVDDLLPTINGQLMFLHSSEKNEFWSALLEKAYAKVHGSYEALKGGTTCEAMEDFTGGITEMYELQEAPKNLFTILLKAFQHNSLMGCSIEPDPVIQEAQTPEGLVKGHAYSITQLKYFDNKSKQPDKIPLVRLRNPWGNEVEWTGAWSDRSPEWKMVSEAEKKEIGLVFEHDGEFWMTFEDLKKHFDRVEICNLNPDNITEEDEQNGIRKWEMSIFEGQWVPGITAGGCRNFLETFHHNPQYIITLTEPDEDDDENKCSIVVALMQRNRRSQRSMGAEFLTIGYAIYYLRNPENLPKPLNLDFFIYNASIARSPTFINLREISCRFRLPPGTYCIVPSTFEPNEEGEFILRVFSEHSNNMEEHDVKSVEEHVDEKEDIEPVPKDPEDQKDESTIKEFFCKIAGDGMEIDWMELKEILDYVLKAELKKDGISKEVCRSMIAMVDGDRSGKLGFDEFKCLWVDIRRLKSVFKRSDKDGSGVLSAFELSNALESAGLRLNKHLLNILMHRYGNSNGMIPLDDFLLCAVKLKGMIEMFKERDKGNTHLATFTMEEWIEKTMYS